MSKKSTVELVNNTIVFGEAFNITSSLKGYSGGIRVTDGGKITGKNNIIYYNTADVDPEWGIGWGGGSIDLTYTASSKKFPGTGNITAKPLFVNSASDDFQLKIGSPCIDKGDPASPKDPDGTPADMGALFINQGTDISSDKEAIAKTNGFKIKTSVYNTSIIISYQLDRSLDVEVEIVNVAGKKVYTLINGRKTAGAHHITWNCRNSAGYKVSPGIYFCRFFAGTTLNVVKMTLLK